MYKFTNGIVVFTEEDKENFIKAGLKLVEEEKNEDNNNGRIIAEESKQRNKTAK